MADRPSPSESSDPSPAQDAQSEPPGLGEQFGRTRSALVGLITAHVNLAKAEFGEIAGQLKRAAAFGGIALLLLFLAGMLVVIGTTLFVGEVVFHSIGWGVLLGSELLIGSAALLVLAIIDLGRGRAFSSFVVALGIGLAVTGVAGPSGGSEQKPVGLVYFGLADEHHCIHVSRTFPGDRATVRELAATFALGCLRRFLMRAETTS